MPKKLTTHRDLSFYPSYPLILITDNGKIEIPAESVKLEQVGEKAFGLSCLPKSWTLPFIVISEKLMSLWNSSTSDNREQLLKPWADYILEAAVSIGINEESQIIIRSSGHSEGLGERGRFHSTTGKLNYIIQALNNYLHKFSSDKDLIKISIPLIIQKCAVPISAKGHLSNERRCYKEKRDWLGEFEPINTKKGVPFKINLRYWRKLISTEDMTQEPLRCNLTALISEVLKIPAAWAYDQKLRLHYEWVWDGKTIYIVQADQERKTTGIEPSTVKELQKSLPTKFKPKYLKEINEVQAKKYYKIRNVFTYSKLGLPTTKLYALDDQSVIKDLALGTVPSLLEEDIAELVKGSLVIRMDIATEEMDRRQLLPRTQEMRELAPALEWLKEKSLYIKKQNIEEDVVFIFHNFVPSVSSAFAYSAPGARQVQIESLWGIPEGLYYNKHDKFLVDTQSPRLEDIVYDEIDGFKIREKINFKQFFVVPDKDGKWETKIIKIPYDWHSSIKRKKWIKEIAFESRRIVEEEGKPLSIMWFVGVPQGVCSRPILPWYHEPYDLKINGRALTHRTKTPFDKSLTIKTNKDVELLREESEKKHPKIRRIKIQPFEENLLRDKDTLHRIGKLARKIDAIILLDGGVLSHPYYQLIKTDAIVEILHPFSDFEEKQDFKKLVRDKVPRNIERKGEIVKKTHLSGEYLLRALREKLIEESFEVLDAVDQESIVNELADVSEIIESILSQLNIKKSELRKLQDQKREKAGGFEEGLILLETEKPLPNKKDAKTGNLFGDFTPSEEFKQSHTISKWSDRREHKAASEAILNLVIPLVTDKWEANTPETVLEFCSGVDASVKIKIIGKRLGGKLHINISVFAPHRQLKLF